MLGRELLIADAHFVGRDESRAVRQELDLRKGFQDVPILGFTQSLNEIVFLGDHFGEVCRFLTLRQTGESVSAIVVVALSGIEQVLARHASAIDARAANDTLFGDADARAEFGGAY